ncbi:MAG TPA: hypothetical protein VFN68_06200 [Acidimicrobiales bacterium]|nr:hypothetical protein [Acidimicrobiales bacterium]
MGSRAVRDVGLARIGTTTRWLTAGTLVIGGVLSAAAAKSLPGRSSHTTSGSAAAPAQAPSQSGTSSAGLPGDDTGGSGGDQSGSAGGLTAPAQAPQPVQSAPVVNSGGS